MVLTRLVGNIDIVRTNKSRGFLRCFVALDFGISALHPAMKHIHIAEELVNKG